MHKGHEYKGTFITFEGIDFCGKSTQVKLLEKYLIDNKIKYIIRREPGGTDIGEHIRSVLLNKNNGLIFDETKAYLFAASRSQLVRKVIIPNLKNRINVITDRFLDSSVAYQGYGRRVGIDKIMEINNSAVNGIKPDITFLLDISVDESLKRKSMDRIDIDRIELSDKEFYERVRDGYLWISERDPERVKVIDGTRSIDDIRQEIINHINKYL